MKTRLIEWTLKHYSDRFVSQWFILLYDLSVVFATFFLAHVMRINFAREGIDLLLVLNQSLLVLAVYLAAFLVTRSHRSIIRHSGFNDSMRILKATGLAGVALLLLWFVLIQYRPARFWIPPPSVIIINFLLAHLFLVWSRFIIKSAYHDFIARDRRKQSRVMIYGAGQAGMLTRNALKGDPDFRHELIAFIDDNQKKVDKVLEGIPVISAEKGLSDEFVSRNNINQIIIAIQGLEPDHKTSIVDRGMELGLKVKVVPSINQWINGQLSLNQLREVRIEELLERAPIKLNNQALYDELRGKTVMVTGAAGSIGSEIVRQILVYYPAQLILVDQAETALYELQNEIGPTHGYNGHSTSIRYVLANIKDRFRMDHVFETSRPQYVFHAAAYKHVPLMEENPYEAVMVNVFGTRVIADLSVKYRALKFVMVSTDKAVNPTNVMGASKRIAEIYTQSLSNGHTQFITTRFGNVLGSNGSVIPLFRKQIEHGGPVTITHKEITRYFMTIPEACRLVLEAGVTGNGGEILIFDMGKSVRIYDLAQKMIRLSGLVPGKDIQITEIGLRPGEKLIEELLAKDEVTLPTHHPQIMRASVRKYDKEEVQAFMDELSQLIFKGDHFALVHLMKQIVPEYCSSNSMYSCLDKA